MNTLHTTLRYVLIGIILVLLGTLTWWYFFLEKKEGAVGDVERGRGLHVEAPEFSSPTGNTYLNLVRSTPSVPLWRGAQDTATAVIDLFTNKKLGSGDEGTRQPTLWHVSELPVAGLAFGTQNTLRFVERATGHLLEATIETKVVSRVANTTTLQVEEAYITGNRVFMRVEEEGVVKTLTALVNGGTEGALMQKKYLENNISSFVVHPNNSITYSVESPGKETSVFSAQPDGTKQKSVTALGTKGWKVYSFDKNRVLLVESAADDVSGYALEVTPLGLSPILRNLSGLTVQTHASSTSLLYGTSERGALSLFVRQNNGSPVQVSLHTVADKCVFAPTGTSAYCAQPKVLPGKEFLNRWYRGETHTSDSWWKVNLEQGTVELIFDPEVEDGVSLDVESPTVSEDGTYLAFRNANDWSLWVLSLP